VGRIAVELYRNPDYQEFERAALAAPREVRGIIMRNGDLWVAAPAEELEATFDFIHSNLVNALAREGIVPKGAFEMEPALAEEFLAVISHEDDVGQWQVAESYQPRVRTYLLEEGLLFEYAEAFQRKQSHLGLELQIQKI
jgi:hypothetical protein